MTWMRFGHLSWSARNLTTISFLVTLATSGLLLIVPVYSGQSGNGIVTVQTHATLLEENGAFALIPLMIPVLMASTPMIFPHSWVRVGATILLALFVFIAGFSIGLFYVPSAVLMYVATLSGLREKQATPLK